MSTRIDPPAPELPSSDESQDLIETGPNGEENIAPPEPDIFDCP